MKFIKCKIDEHPKLAQFAFMSKLYAKDIPMLIASCFLYLGIAFVVICPFLVLGYVIDKAFHYSFTVGIWTVAIPVCMILYCYIVSKISLYLNNRIK